MPILACPESIGARIRFCRHAHRLTLEELSAKCEMNPAELSRLERDLYRRPSLQRIQRIAKELGILTSHLTGEIRLFAERTREDHETTILF